VQSVYYMNKLNSFNNGLNGTREDVAERFLAERFRFYLQYGDPKTIRAVIGFEGDGNYWGDGSSGRNHMSNLNTDQVALEIKHAYLDMVIPQTPLTLRAGMFWWDVGGGFFMAQDAPGFKLTANFAPHKISAFMYREYDESTTTYNVSDMYGLQYLLKQKMFDLEAYFAYLNDLRDHDIGGGNYTDQPWFAGVIAGYRPGNWDFGAQFNYSGGTMKARDSGYSDIDYKGWAAKASANYKIGPGLIVGIEGFYSTGNDADKTDEIDRFRVANNSETYSGFGNYRSVYFYKASGVFGPNYNGYQGDFSTNWPWGTWYGDVNVEYSPTAWLRLIANYMYIGDTAKGTPGARQDKDEDYVGSEINLTAQFRVYKSTQFIIGGGYFFPGDVFDTPTKSADNGYNILSRLVYSF
jgi:hypothetical protein